MSERILIVDDQERDRRLLEALLGPYGYTVMVATSGDEALASIAADPPDLVMLDVVMPGMSGYDVCRRIRADGASAHIPVVMLTASQDQDKVAGPGGRR
jgi:two-component system cell cycle response regulator